MGILKDLFTGFPIPIKDFLCDTCNDVVEDPVGLDPCEHIFCKSCIGPVTWVQAECPVQGCGQQFTGQRKPARAYLNLLTKLEVRCPFRVAIFKGCTWSGMLGELDGHQKACEYNPNKPTHGCIERCGAKLLAGKEEEHQCTTYLKEELEKTRLALRKSDLERGETEGKLKTLEKKFQKTEEELKSLKCKRKMVRDLDPTSWSSSSSSSGASEEDEDKEESSGSIGTTSPNRPIVTRSGGKWGPAAKRGGMAPEK